MKKLLVMRLVAVMSMAVLAGCTDGGEDADNADASDIVNSEIESELASEDVLEDVSAEMTIEEKIASEMPAKLDVGEDESSSVLPGELFFDEYLINQAEQLTYLIGMYQNDTENSKEYYDIIMNYLFYNENELFTFDCNDERLEGTGLACLQLIVFRPILYDFMEYDQDLYLDGVISDSSTNVRNIVYEHTNQ